MTTLIIRCIAVFSLISLAACGSGGGGGGGGTPTPSTYTIGGTVSGLSGTVVLQNNGGDNLSRSSNGSFSFATALADDADYAVSVLTQPGSPNQTCVVTNGAGTVNGANITNINVTCTTNTYAVSGTISGLDGTVVLQNNGGDNLSRSANGDFTFATGIADGSDYDVSVLTQPSGPNQTCIAGNSSGTVDGAEITDITITCTTNTYSVGGTIIGLSGTVVLQNNGGDNLTRNENGGFTFATPIADGTNYDITVLTQPLGQVCTVTNGTGALSGVAVSNVAVSCLTSYSIGGTISGLDGTVVLQNNGADDLPVAANGSFTFVTEVADGGGYTVTVLTQPTGPNQTCIATGNTGTVSGADITGVSIDCTTNTYAVGGTISGLDGTVVLQNNGGDDLTISANGNFTFATAVTDGDNYDVTVLTQPADQICTVTNGAGALGGSAISDVAVSCLTTHSIGGTISGLIGTVVLQNNGGDNLSLSADGAFTFATAIADGSAYTVSVLTQPVGQVCIPSNNTGVVSGSDVATLDVQCAQSLSLTLQGAKTFHFSWTDVDGETEYRLREDPDGVSGYTEIVPLIAANETSYDLEVFLPTRVNARYILQACDAGGCSDSAPAIVSGTLAEAVGYVKASNTNAGDAFGNALALSADGATLAVGAPFEDGNGSGEADNGASDSGAVYVFAKSGNAWSQQAYLKASSPGAGDFFGAALALAGDGATLAVGAPGESSDATGIGGDQSNNDAPNAGAVYVFTQSGGIWSQQAYVKASNTGTSDFFGTALALAADGATLAVGATGEDSAATDIGGNQTKDCDPITPVNCSLSSGAVYVFTQSGGAWSQQAYVKASNTRPAPPDPTGSVNVEDFGDNFGNALALAADGNTLAVGAWHEHSSATGINGNQADVNAPFSGAVYVFTRDGTWSQQAYIKASYLYPPPYYQYWFGSSLALAADGNTLAVGATHENSDATGINGNQVRNQALLAGAVYVYVRDGTWSQQAYIKASNTEADDRFGGAVTLSADGDTLAVGASLEDSAATGIEGDQTDNNAGNAGAVYVFTRAATTWSHQSYLKASNTDPSDSFGQALALAGDGSVLAVGATLEDSAVTGIDGDQANNGAANAGAVYLY